MTTGSFHLASMLLALAGLASACVTCEAPAPVASPALRIEANVQDAIQVRVVPLVDEDLECRVAVVSENGSNSATGTGSFELQPPNRLPAVLMATSPTGQIGWRSLDPDKRGPVAFDLDQPGAFVDLTLQRAEDTRVAIFKGPDRLHDLTLRPGKTRRLVVPTGAITVQLTSPGAAPVHCDLDPGEVIALDLGS